jgi:large subunit ribosomal protein L10
MNLALKNKKIELNDYMSGPNAYLFSDSIIEPIKVVTKFAKEHPALEVRVGYIDKEIVDVNTINQYATIPSMEGLLTMFAGGLIEHVRNLSIGLNLYAEKLEKGGNN